MGATDTVGRFLVTVFGTDAFEQAGLESVVISYSVNTIGTAAFWPTGVDGAEEPA